MMPPLMHFDVSHRFLQVRNSSYGTLPDGSTRKETDLNSLNFRTSIRPVPRSAMLSHPDYYVWGASMLSDSTGRCHLFAARWPREMGFHAWVTHSEIAHAVADEPLGPYHFVDVALPARGRDFWDGLCTHNPTALELDGRYYLFYMGTRGVEPPGPALEWKDFNFEFRNNQRIGVAVAEHPSGPWKRMDVPLVEVESDSSAPDALCMANPTVTRRREGDFLMIYKAVGLREPLPFGGPVVHRVALADHITGPYVKQPGLVFTVAGESFPAEDPYIWFDTPGDCYYGLVKDFKGFFTGAGASLALLCSQDGIDWNPAPHALATTLEIPWQDGFEAVHRLERPQVWLRDGQPAVLFVAACRDESHSFNVHIPLEGITHD